MVTLYSKSRALAKPVEEWMKHEGVELKVVETVPPRGVKAQILLHGCSLNSSVEKAAARLGGVPCVVPESLDWVLERCQRGLVDVMVGYDWVRTGLL